MQDVIPVASRANPESTARIANHPVHSHAGAFFFQSHASFGALLTDLAYWRTR